MLCILFLAQWFLTTSILRYALPKTLGTIFNVIYFAISILLSILNALKPDISPGFTYASSILPVLQLNNFIKVAYIASNSGVDLHFGNLEDPVADVKASKIMVIGAIESLVLLVILLYCWPMYVDPNFEKPYPWYYPFTARFWCSHDDDPEQVDEEEGHQQLIPSGELQ